MDRIGFASMWAALPLVAACDTLGQTEQTELSEPTEPPILRKCTGCGDNGVLVRDFKFHELNANGRPNAEGVSLRAFLSRPDESGAREPLRLTVTGDVLAGSTLSGMPVPLVGTQMIIDRQIKTGVESYLLEIEEVDETTYWVEPAGVVPKYRIGWRPLDSTKLELESVCNPDGEGVSDFALIFQGDRYDIDTLTVRTAKWVEPDLTWFNISCLGNVVSKLHLLRHTAAGSDAAHRTSVDKRTAMLKMITGDYCGNGYQFTHDGVPLRYVTRDGWHIEGLPDHPTGDLTDVALDGDFYSVDAVWSHRGAECIDFPRLVYEEEPNLDRWEVLRRWVTTVDPDGACWPDIGEIPLCSDQSPTWQNYGHVLSVNPRDRRRITARQVDR